jgi:hypothetical protein
MEDKVSAILGGLRKHFYCPTAFSWKDQTHFVVQLGPSVFDGQLSFPFKNSDLEVAYPIDVVNSIWEYIEKYVF